MFTSYIRLGEAGGGADGCGDERRPELSDEFLQKGKYLLHVFLLTERGM